MTTERKTAVITGGTKGIGLATAVHLAGLGYDLAISYSTDEAAARLTEKAIRDAGREALVLQADVRHQESVEGFFAKAVERFGRPYAVIANAGIEIVDTPIGDMTEVDLDRVVDINIKGTFFTLQQAARSVMDGGRVIATGSIIAQYPPAGAGAYAATKAAVRTMIEVLSLELGPRGVSVNSLNPGPVEGAGIFTQIPEKLHQHFVDITPLGSLPTPQDLVGAVEFLLSDGGRMISGHHLAITGGFRMG